MAAVADSGRAKLVRRRRRQVLLERHLTVATSARLLDSIGRIRVRSSRGLFLSFSEADLIARWLVIARAEVEEPIGPSTSPDMLPYLDSFEKYYNEYRE